MASAVNVLRLVLLVLGLVALLWVAYNIGKVILRLVAGLAFLALIAAAVWILLFRTPHPRNPPHRSHHGSHLLPPLRSQA